MEMLSQFLELFVLDLRNMMGVLFWGNLALAVLIFAFRFTNFSKDNNTQLLVFGGSKIIQSFAWLVLFFRVDTNIFIPLDIIISNTLLFASYYVESIAMLMIVKDRSRKAYHIQSVIFTIIILSFYYSIYVEAPAYIRVSLASFSIFLLLFLPTLRFLTAARSSLFKKILGFNYIILLIAMSIRTIDPLFKTSITLYSDDATQKTIFLIVFLMMIISGVGYLLLLQEEKEIQIKKLLSDKDTFFSIIAHDLRGPFSGIIGLSELLLEENNDLNKKEANEFIQLINQSSKETYSLLENLLTWAQSQTGSIHFSPKKVAIAAVIDKTISLLDNMSKNKNITIQSQIENDQYVFADKDMLETIFRNLISNAIKFTNVDGEVLLFMEKVKGQMVFSVQDNGVGIAPEKIKNLFATNYRSNTLGTNHETGTGLGLMLCKDFVEKHGGEIWVESQVGKGSIFKFSISN